MYEPRETALVRYARASARNDAITDELYDELAGDFSVPTIIQICFVVGLAGMTNRFHRTFLTRVDPHTQEAVATSCPIPIPAPPASS